ncbi:MAG: iron ABC transporter permease [Streptococcaceae bacterium]|jgi:iron complex transport system permease protein|nr:iron ABC transporter permease [Streptococcaceae bacterium]
MSTRRFIFAGLTTLFFIVLDLLQYPDNLSALQLLIFQFRLPRLIAVALAAVALAVSGLIIQTITENPLADSGTMGLTSGASAGAVAFMLLSERLNLSSVWTFSYPIFAVAGAGLAFSLIYFFAIRKKLSNSRILLTGIAVTALFQALITLLQLAINPNDFQQIATWIAGDVWQTDTLYLAILAGALLILMLLLHPFAKRLELLSLGDEQATTLGLNVPQTKRRLYLLALGFASIGVALVGGLAFLGLIAPHIARRLTGFSIRKRLTMTVLTGLSLLILADFLSQTLIAPSTLPLGFIVAAIGAPYYIYLIQKEI